MDWDKIARVLEKLHAPSARKTADEIRRVRLLLHDDKISIAEQMEATRYLKKKMDGARRMYPSTDWDEEFGLKASVTDITPETKMEQIKREVREELTDAENYNNSNAGKYRKGISERSEQKHFESEIVDVQNKIFDSSTSGELGEGQMFYNNNMSITMATPFY